MSERERDRETERERERERERVYNLRSGARTGAQFTTALLVQNYKY